MRQVSLERHGQNRRSWKVRLTEQDRETRVWMRDMRRNDFCMTRDRRQRLVHSGKGFGDAAHVVEELGEQSSQRQPRRQNSGDLLRLTGYLHPAR